MIWTNSEQLAQEYIFEMKEQFVFIKYITRKEIGAVKIVKTPVLDFKDIARMGVVMKRARYFITCNGRTDDLFRQDEDYIVSQLMGAEPRHALQISHSGLYRQLSLFDDNNENYAPLTASSR